MNKEAILRVADAIENAELAKDGIGFNMASFYIGLETNGARLEDKSGHNCGTIGCIAGWTCILNGASKRDMKNPMFNCDYIARDLLGLDFATADTLFYADTSPYELEDIPSAQAVRTLRHLAETGEVSWEV
jgi:hypothetical protein